MILLAVSVYVRVPRGVPHGVEVDVTVIATMFLVPVVFPARPSA